MFNKRDKALLVEQLSHMAIGDPPSPIIATIFPPSNIQHSHDWPTYPLALKQWNISVFTAISHYTFNRVQISVAEDHKPNASGFLCTSHVHLLN